MKTLILVRSYYGNTKQVADPMARRMKSAGHDADVQDIDEGSRPAVHRRNQIKEGFEPGAEGIMPKIAKDHILNLFAGTLRCEVSGMKVPLADNAIRKAVAYANEFIAFGRNVKRAS